MNCCDAFGHCMQGHGCPVRRQPPYPATLPPDLPVWPKAASKPVTRRRAANLALALAGRLVMVLCLMSAAISLAIWISIP